MNLFLAFLWLAGGVGLLVYQQLTGKTGLSIRGTNISFGWLLLALSLYNVMRWWQVRTAHRLDQQARWVLEARRHEHQHRETPRERDPNFIFTDEPPPPSPQPNPNVTDQPPPPANH